MAYKVYTPEFKAKVVIEVIQGAKSLNDIAAQNNLNPNMVCTWKAEFHQKASSVFEDPQKTEKEASRKEEALEKETNRMLKKTGELILERDFLQDCFRKTGIPVPDFDPD